MESLPETNFDILKNEMQKNGFVFLKTEFMKETNFKTETKLFTEEAVGSLDSIKREYERNYPDLEIEVKDSGDKNSCYVFGKIKK
jgi:hypothetical protein